MLQFRRIVFSVVSALALAAPVYAGKLAIVIDDFGYRPHYENQVLAMPSAISVAVLPNAPHAREMATKAHSSGHQVLIHLPMAPLSKQPLEKDTLRPDMSSEEIERIIRDAYNKVPYAVGLNNHMGSAMTSSLYGMLKVMQALERYNLYFLDSMTIGNSQAMRAAQAKWDKLQRGVAEFSITLALGRADLFPETPVRVSGFKRVIDEQAWLISKVTHNLSNSGFTTSLELEVKLSDVEYKAEDDEG